jgi:hypothetical protein
VLRAARDAGLRKKEDNNMDEYDTPNIIYVTEDDERNARPIHRHHQKGQMIPRDPFGLPRPRRPRHIVIQDRGNRDPVVVREVREPERVMAPMPFERRLFGNLTTSEVVESAAELMSALQSLPVAPVATGKLETDIENLTLYHAAVALHFKRVEQLRTIGSLLGKLIS